MYKISYEMYGVTKLTFCHLNVRRFSARMIWMCLIDSWQVLNKRKTFIWALNRICDAIVVRGNNITVIVVITALVFAINISLFSHSVMYCF